MKTTWLVVGLGNPEGKYFQTYHNVGFLALDLMAARLGLEFKKKGNQIIATNKELILLKPLTYMNLSGQAVLAVARKHKIAPENIIVIGDDLYIEPGNIRVKAGGSHGGHNGMRSVTELLRTNAYIKIRVGIKPAEPPKSGTANYVLSKIDTEVRPLIDAAIERAVDVALSLTKGESLSHMQQVHNR